VFTLEINKTGQAPEMCQTKAVVMLIASDQLGVGMKRLAVTDRGFY